MSEAVQGIATAVHPVQPHGLRLFDLRRATGRAAQPMLAAITAGGSTAAAASRPDRLANFRRR